jgi:NADH-quinone oxidoreductase subunit D
VAIEVSEAESKTLSLPIGPQHPGSGHFRLGVQVDGDIIVDAIPDPGYVHRGAEKMCEYRNWFQNIPHLERPVIIDAIGITLPYCIAYERLLGWDVPPRAHYLRMIMAELDRITSHLYWLGIYGPFLGHTTMFMWPMGDREYFIDLEEAIGGQRQTFSYAIPGGVRNDMPESFPDKARRTCDYFDRRLKEYDRIFFKNPLVMKRTQDIGVMTAQEAMALGVTGPNLRASDVHSDLRKDDPYEAYADIDFHIPVYPDGDCWARAMVRRIELHESLEIIRACLKKMPSGPVNFRARGGLSLPPGEAFARTEAARGTMAFHVVANPDVPKAGWPYRVKISVPSFRSLPAMPFLIKGVRLADVPAIYWSLDYWPVEADK